MGKTPYGPRTRQRRKEYTRSGVSRLKQGSIVHSETADAVSFGNYHLTDDNVFSKTLLDHYLSETLDIGGSFLSLKIEHDFPVVANYAQGSAFGLTWNYTGPVFAYPHVRYGPGMSEASVRSVAGEILDPLDIRIALGGTAISRCKPATPEASMAVAAIELYREGLPKLVSHIPDLASKISFFRSLGDNYLNVTFGWKPFVSELKKSAQALVTYQDSLVELRAHSGERMRRQYRFPDVVTREVLVQDMVRPWPNLNAYVMGQEGRTVSSITTKKTWFSGEFIYHFPDRHDSWLERAASEARHMLGIDLTPETLWNITPWTWMADWFANVGDVMSNLSAMSSDDLVLRYGYLMQEVVREYHHVHGGISSPESPGMPSVIRGVTRISAKSRIKATPYGFGLNWDGFSAQQLAILAALGVTQGRVSR